MVSIRCDMAICQPFRRSGLDEMYEARPTMERGLLWTDCQVYAFGRAVRRKCLGLRVDLQTVLRAILSHGGGPSFSLACACRSLVLSEDRVVQWAIARCCLGVSGQFGEDLALMLLRRL